MIRWCLPIYYWCVSTLSKLIYRHALTVVITEYEGIGERCQWVTTAWPYYNVWWLQCIPPSLGVSAEHMRSVVARDDGEMWAECHIWGQGVLSSIPGSDTLFAVEIWKPLLTLMDIEAASMVSSCHLHPIADVNTSDHLPLTVMRLDQTAVLIIATILEASRR